MPADAHPEGASERAEANRTSRVDTESRALLVAAAGFVLAGPASVLYFLTRSNPISGQGSVGDIAAVAAAAFGLIAFASAYTISYIRPASRRATRLRRAPRKPL